MIDIRDIPKDKTSYLTILHEDEKKSKKTKNQKRARVYVFCKCICGNIISTRLDSVNSNKKKSCGCKTLKSGWTNNAAKKHGYSTHRAYDIFLGMKQRCYDKNNINYFRYGGRGIKICAEWLKNPIKFVEWSLKNGYDKGLQCDRRDNDKGYSPENCRWVTSEVNNNNKRSNIKYEYNGEFLTLPQIAKRTEIGFPTLYRRINENKLSLEQALSIPLYGKCKKDRISKRMLTKESAIEIFLSKDKIENLERKFRIDKSTIARIRSKKSYQDCTEGFTRTINYENHNGGHKK